MPLVEIDKILAEHDLDRSKRVAQRQLAREVLAIVHGEDEIKTVEAQHGLFFNPSKTAIKRDARAAARPEEAAQARSKSTDLSPLLNKYAGPDKTKSATNVVLPRSLVANQQIGRVLYAAGLVASRSEGHRLVAKKGAYIGSLAGKQHTHMPDHVEFTPVGNWANDYINRFIVDNQLLVVRAGKWRVKVIRIVEDTEFERRGLDAPGWRDFKKEQQERERASGSH